MEDYTNYTNILSTEEKALLENLINKLAVSGLRQYNTQAATILFNKWMYLSDDDLLEKTTIRKWVSDNTLDEVPNINSPKICKINSIQEIKDNLEYLDDYVMEMQDIIRNKPLITNFEHIRHYIDIINKRVSNLK